MMTGWVRVIIKMILFWAVGPFLVGAVIGTALNKSAEYEQRAHCLSKITIRLRIAPKPTPFRVVTDREIAI